MEARWKRMTSLFLVLVMVFTMIPTAALAAGVNEDLVSSLAEVYDGDEERARQDLDALYEAGIIDGSFEKVWARSESPLHTQHVTLKEMLAETQRDFSFENIDGTLVCVYFPDYMDGINAPGWHLHFLSEDHTAGGHVFELKMKQGEVFLDKLSRIEIQLPREAAFDTYALKEASHDEIRQVEQGQG